jgi:hypothetical protein
MADPTIPPALTPLLRPITDAEFRAILIEHGYIEPWEPTPDGGFTVRPKPVLPPTP